MTDTRVDSAYGDPPPPVCPRCARRVDMEAIGPQVGLCHCLSCQRYACRWCWLKARGRCPMCAAPYEVWGAAAATATGVRPRRRRRKLDRRAAAMLVALIAVLSLVSLSTIGWLGSVGGAEGRATARPGAVGGLGSSGGPGSTTAGIGDPTASAGASGSPSDGPSAGSSDVPGSTPRSNPTPAGGNETAAPGDTPAPTATAIATPKVTPKPTPRPTPTPVPTPTAAPTPTPTPCFTVPDLSGLTVIAAKAEWATVGFTGRVITNPPGHTSYVVVKDSQNLPKGSCQPASSSVSVTTVAP